MKRNLSKLKYLIIMSTLGVVMFSTTAYAEENTVENTESTDSTNIVTELNDTEPDEPELYTGWYEINGHKYYYVDNERVENSFMTIDGYTYYFNEEGIYITKSFKTIDNYIYYFDTHGYMVTGFAAINKQTYYFDTNGHMITGWNCIDDNWYYFDRHGYMCKGWQEIGRNIWYYFGTNGKMHKSSLSTINNKIYYFDSHGIMRTGWNKFKDNWYYSNTNGVIQKNKWVYDKNNWYYLDENSIMTTGWKSINNKWYYFNYLGIMHTGWLYYNNNYYYFNSDNGKMVTKWLYWNNEWYYFNPSTGKMVTNGWGNDAKNNWYYLDSNGHITANSWITWSNKKYYLGKDGIAYKNIQTKINNVIYYFRSDCSAKQSEDPLAGELALKLGNLKAAFDYVKTSYKWGGRNTWDEHDTSKSLAEFGIKNNWGNCFVYAGAFRELAAEMGYDAHQVWGVVPYPGNRVVKHSWVEIVINGTTYVYDPEASWQYKKDYYQFKYGDSGTFRYEVQGRMN